MQRGFTLIELTVVLAVIGLIIGGVVIGTDVLDHAEVRSMQTQVNSYLTAYRGFKMKYEYPPGDQPNAFTFFGPGAGCTNASVATVAAGCNGNGDGKLGLIPTDWEKESLRAWQFLALEGLIPGSFDGVKDAAYPGNCPMDKVVPSSKYSGGGYEILNSAIYGGAGLPDIGNVISVSAPDNLCLGSALFTPQVAQQIDVKYDDGLPQRGKIQFITGNGNSGNCLSGGNYTLTNTGIACHLFFAAE